MQPACRENASAQGVAMREAARTQLHPRESANARVAGMRGSAIRSLAGFQIAFPSFALNDFQIRDAGLFRSGHLIGGEQPQPAVPTRPHRQRTLDGMGETNADVVHRPVQIVRSAVVLGEIEAGAEADMPPFQLGMAAMNA